MNTNSEFSADLITISRSILKQALEALEWISDCHVGDDDDAGECASCHERSYKPHAPDCKKNNAITALRAALAHQAELVQEKIVPPAKLPVPQEWHTELATICFARSYNGEGSYYCPHCDTNAGSVWVDHAWRPTKWQAICYNCRNSFNE